MLPVIPFSKHFMDTTVRMTTVQSLLPNAHAYRSLRINEFLSGNFTRLKSVFSQIRINRIELYLIPAIGLNRRGFHVVHLAPKDEFVYTKDLQFNVAASWPGSKMGRISESLSLTWHPTDSMEKVWFPTAAKTILVDFFYISTGMDELPDEVPEYQLVFDFHVTLRGISKASLKCEQCNGCIDDGDLAI